MGLIRVRSLLGLSELLFCKPSFMCVYCNRVENVFFFPTTTDLETVQDLPRGSIISEIVGEPYPA